MTFDGIAVRFHQMSESASKIFLEGDSDIKMNRSRFSLMSSRSRFSRRLFDSGDRALLGPLFIVGSPRSGTSVLVEALQNAGYAGYNEGNLLSLLHTLDQNVDQHFSVFGSQDPNILTSHIHKDVLKSRLFQQLRYLVEGHFAGRQWLDKTGNPEMMLAIPIIRALWPQSVFIFAKRRGLENVVSRLQKFPQYDFAYHCADWARNMSVWREQRAAFPDLRYIELDQWEMAHAAPQTAARISAFLKLNPQQEQIILGVFHYHRPQQTDNESTQRVLTLEATGWTADQQETFQLLCGESMRDYHYTEDASYRSTAAV